VRESDDCEGNSRPYPTFVVQKRGIHPQILHLLSRTCHNLRQAGVTASPGSLAAARPIPTDAGRTRNLSGHRFLFVDDPTGPVSDQCVHRHPQPPITPHHGNSSSSKCGQL
jgi:hypothetical protein